jgi:hypothetical protein
MQIVRGTVGTSFELLVMKKVGKWYPFQMMVFHMCNFKKVAVPVVSASYKVVL